MIEDLKDLVMIMLDIDIWGGDTALHVHDLSLGAGGHLPQSEPINSVGK